MLKRQIPLAIVFLTGMATLFGWFVDNVVFETFVNDTATQWFDIIASFAMILGSLNLLRVQGEKVLRRKRNWIYSIFAIGGFFFSITVGFLFRGANYVEISDLGPNQGAISEVIASAENIDPKIAAVTLSLVEENEVFEVSRIFITESGAKQLVDDLNANGAKAEFKSKTWGGHILEKGTLFNWMFVYLFTPLSATMFALLAFFVASASYRAFRIRNFEATLLLISGIIIMVGRVPLGSLISPWFVLYLIVLGGGIVSNSYFKDVKRTFQITTGGILVVTIAGFIAGWSPDSIYFLSFPVLQEWIYSVPNIAGSRAIMIGIALGMVGTSLRIILGIEKSFLGE